MGLGLRDPYCIGNPTIGTQNIMNLWTSPHRLRGLGLCSVLRSYFKGDMFRVWGRNPPTANVHNLQPSFNLNSSLKKPPQTQTKLSNTLSCNPFSRKSQMALILYTYLWGPGNAYVLESIKPNLTLNPKP